MFRAVRQGLRASVESCSIKKLEPFYEYGRDVNLPDAISHCRLFKRYSLWTWGRKSRCNKALADNWVAGNPD
jgi:hypothetical protein